MPNYPDFPVGEYENRYRRAREMMQAAEIDALLITDDLNYIYFTGHRSQQNQIDKLRPYIFILPKDDEGVLITAPSELQQVRETTWVSDVRTAGLMGRSDEIIAVLKEHGLQRARIGAELGREQYLGISFNEFSHIRNALSGADFVDASPTLLSLRAVKSPLEVEFIRKAGEIVATAEAETLEAARIGMTELDIACILRTRIAQHGGERVTFLVVSSGDALIPVATERKIEEGDIVVIDTGVEYRGYCSDVSRSASVGNPSETVAEFYRWMMTLRHRCVDVLRIGKTPGDVVTVCREVIAERHLDTADIGRIGHGVGLETTEYPSLTMEEDVVFESGMVFACNPNFVRDFGFINAEDNWVITENGPEVLSSPAAPTELPIISTS